MPAETIPFDQCICEGARKPKRNCWATVHNTAPVKDKK